MQRDVIIILGKTGFGKSTWLQQYLQGVSKCFPFDPFGSIPAEYLEQEKLIERFDAGYFRDTPKFSVGTRRFPDMPILGSISYLTGKCCFVIEECGVAFGKGERIEEWLQEIIFLGRHNEVSLVLTAQRAASIPVDLRSQASRFISFRQTEKNDINWTEQYIGQRIEELNTLPRFECLDAEGENVSRYALAKPVGLIQDSPSQSKGVFS